jgi:hypothetical protein
VTHARRSRSIRCTHNAHKLAVVEPVKTTRVTTIDDHAAAAEIEMGVHCAVAFGTIELPPQFVGRGSFGSRYGIALLRLQLLNEIDEGLHGDEHAPALAA